MKVLREYQQQAVDTVMQKLHEGIDKQLVCMATGCHAKDTPILMWDGQVKPVQNIVVGDKLMGDDSTPRNVLSLARGNETMYEVTPVKGDSFLVNENHILALKRTSLPPHVAKYHSEFLNISIKNYLSLTKNKKHLYKLYRTGVSFSNGNIGSPTHPYWIGLWLGDGSVDRPVITIPDIEIEEWFFSEFAEFCKWNHPEVTIKKKEPEGKCVFFVFTREPGGLSIENGGQVVENTLLPIVRSLYVNGEKRILDRLLRGDRQTRLQVLAGLLDSDGNLHDGNVGYEITTKYRGLADDILFLARSLGFAAYCKDKIGKIASINFEGLYYRIGIVGNTNEIPCKIKRKQSKERLQIKDVLVTGFSLKQLSPADYYGFELDGNHLYCMGDFTVTHNTGKTLTAASIIKKFPGRTLWITHTEELIEQSALAILREEEFFSNELLAEIEKKNGIINALKAIEISNLFNTPVVGEDLIRFKEHIGIVKQESMNIEAKVVVASIQTLWRRLDKIPVDHFDLVVVDEAHYALARTWTKALEHFNPKLRLGLTATPYRLDGQSLKYLFDEIVVDKDIKFGIDNNFLCELNAIRIKTEFNLDSVRTTGGELNDGDLEKIVDTPRRNKLIVDSYRKYADGRQALVFCVTVQHAINVHQAFTDAGIISSFVVGDEKLCPDRKERISLFNSGEITVMSNVMVLTAGFDHPECSCIIMARPTKSLVVYLQAIGRGTRLKKGYKDCIILDIVDASSRHSLINSWTLDQDKQLEDKVFIGKEKKKELIEKRDAARKAKVLDNVKKDEKVNLFKVPKMREITSEKMQEPATEKQLAWIQRLGYDIINNEYTKAMCSDIISIQPISEKQRWFLKANNYDTAGEITIGMFGEAKSEIEKRDADKMRTSRRKVFFNDLK